MSVNTANGPPGIGRHFYAIQPRDDGCVDVYLRPDVIPMTTPDGSTDYDISVIVVRSIDPNDARFGADLEGHIRANYDAWCESGEIINL